MSEYGAVRGGRLKLKGGASTIQKKKKKTKRKREEGNAGEELGMTKHGTLDGVTITVLTPSCQSLILWSYLLGTWRKVKCFEEICEKAILETVTGGYVFAEDTGYFSLGENRSDGESVEGGGGNTSDPYMGDISPILCVVSESGNDTIRCKRKVCMWPYAV